MDVGKRFAANLVRCRKRANLSQEDLALRAGLSRNQISRIERLKTLPRIDTVLKLSGALAVPSRELTKGIVWEPPQGSEEGRFEFFAPFR